MTEIVITGLGATTPLGGDLATTWSNMLAGKSGVRRITEEWAEELPVKIAAYVAQDPAEVIDRVKARRLDRSTQLALIAAQEAWTDAGFDWEGDEGDQVDPYRLIVSLASGIGGLHCEVFPGPYTSAAQHSHHQQHRQGLPSFLLHVCTPLKNQSK